MCLFLRFIRLSSGLFLVWSYWNCDPIGSLCSGGRGYCHYSGLWHQIQKSWTRSSTYSRIRYRIH